MIIEEQVAQRAALTDGEKNELQLRFLQMRDVYRELQGVTLPSEERREWWRRVKAQAQYVIETVVLEEYGIRDCEALGLGINSDEVGAVISDLNALRAEEPRH